MALHAELIRKWHDILRIFENTWPASFIQDLILAIITTIADPAKALFAATSDSYADNIDENSNSANNNANGDNEDNGNDLGNEVEEIDEALNDNGSYNAFSLSKRRRRLNQTQYNITENYQPTL
ncbi:hypothetical protein HK100_004997, partial [Physocladia obscura]